MTGTAGFTCVQSSPLPTLLVYTLLNLSHVCVSGGLEYSRGITGSTGMRGTPHLQAKRSDDR
jgi:hypothetical protein